MIVPQSEFDKVSVEGLVALPDLSQDDEFSMLLSSDILRPRSDYILIAALANASRPWIYRISLPDYSTAV